MGVQDSLGSEPRRPTPEVHEMTNADQNTRSVFRAPPGWPPVPPGWIPPAGWTPDPTWPPAPPDWRFWEPADVKPTATQCAGTISHHEEEDTSWGIDTAYGPNDARSY